MIPERARLLVVRVVQHLGLAGQDGLLRLAVIFRRQVAAVQVGGDARGVTPVVGAVGALVDLEDMPAAPSAGGQVVVVGDLDRLAAAGLDGEAGVGAVVGPDVGVGQLAVQLLARRLNIDRVLRHAIGARAR